MFLLRKRSSTSNYLRVPLRSSSTGQGLTALTSASAGLIISTICDNEAAATTYTAAGSTIETITTLGTFATPTATKCRFKEVDATNHPGLYELQFDNTRFAVASSKSLRVTISGATSLMMKTLVIQLSDLDVDDPVRAGLTALPNVAQGNAGQVATADASARVDLGKALGTAVTLDANNVLNVSTKYVGGTLQTARDIGLSVLLSVGTGTGQVNLVSGKVPVITLTSSDFATDAFAAAAFSAAAVTKIQTGLSTAAQVSGLAVNTRANLNVPIEIETPDASTQTYKVRLHLFDVEGNMEAPDSTPTVTLTNAAGTSRASRLSAASNPSTGVYTWDYTATAGDAEEQLVWVFTVVEGGLTRTYPATSYVVEETAYRFSSSDRATLQLLSGSHSLQAIYDNVTSVNAGLTNGTVILGPTQVFDNTGTWTGSVTGTPTAAAIADAVWDENLTTHNVEDSGSIYVRSIAQNLATLLGKFTGITLLAQWLGLIVGKQVGNTTARTELNATGAGSGTYDETTDSQQAIRDRGDAAWIGAGGGVDVISETTTYSLGGSTASDVFLQEAYDAANEDRYVGNLLVWNGQARLIETYGNSGSGGDIVVSEPFTDAPAAGDTLTIVLNRDVGSGGSSGGTGTGDTPVDHDGGDGVTVDGQPSETDILWYVDGDGAGVPNLFIRAYLTSDYEADPPVRVALGTTTTGSDGRWAAPLMLDAGTYTLIADRSGDGFEPQVNTLVVP